MTRVIVMDREMAEPLTVVEIPHYLMREVEQGRGWLKMPVPEDYFSWLTLVDQIPNIAMSTRIRVVLLKMEPIYRDRRVSFWVATPDDEELALLLRAVFLPGQLTEVRRREVQSWFQGALGGAPPR